MNPSALSTPNTAAVPVEYAEKAMGSLMKLHGELMEEKERRVDLYRRLMEKEQALAELKMYVKLLEEKVEAPKPAEASRPEPLRVVPPAPPRVAPRPPPPPQRPEVRAVKPSEPRPVAAARPLPGADKLPGRTPAPAPEAPPHRPTADGWKSW